MISNLKLSTVESSKQMDLSSGVFARFDADNGVIELSLSDLEEYWQYANDDEIESISVSTNGKYVIAEFSVASGQGGVVTVWDEDGRLVHISNGEYGIASTIFKGYVYTLQAICFYGHPLSYAMAKVPFGTMDAWGNYEVDENFKFDVEGAYKASRLGETIKLKATVDRYVISFGGNDYGIVRNETKAIRVDDLFYFVFGIALDANDEDKIKKCVHKAYLDLCRTIKFKFSSSKIEEMKNKNSSQEKKNKAEEFEKQKTEFINSIENLIIEAVNNKEMLEDFDVWHKKLSKKIKDNSRGKSILIDEKDKTGLSCGQIQKWINMTLKYMRIMGLTDSCLENKLHIPLDDYILKAASYNENEKICDSYEVYGLGIDNSLGKWSEISEYDKYMDYEDSVRRKIVCPIEWESKAWIAEATIRSIKEKN